MKVNGFDIDGVIHFGNSIVGIRPGPHDVIITGRSFEEEPETLAFLRRNGINNIVFFNPMSYNDKTSVSSGLHKVSTIKKLLELGIEVAHFFEDDPVQASILRGEFGMDDYATTKVIHIDNPWVPKGNRRHLEDLHE